MQKIFSIFLMAAIMCVSVCGCSATPVEKKITEAVFTGSHGNVRAAPLEYVESEPEYDNNVNYMTLMIRYAVRGDTDALESAVTARNAKIIGQSLDDELMTVQEFLGNFEQYAGFSVEKDYTNEMMACCVAGDIDAGREAEASRNLKMDAVDSQEPRIAFDELYLLSKVITNEAGCWWLSMDWKMAVGEVLLNRVASVEFPNTLEECVYQEGQYSGVCNFRFQNMIPYEDCVEAATRLLNGERVLNEPSAVFQSGEVQGSGICLKLYDELMGFTYICYSSHPELYV